MTGFPFPGQTEYFAAEFGVKKYGMLAWSEQLKIILVTIHQPLKDVPKLITAENVLEKIILLNNYLKHYEKKRKPKIGVLALNPHAFEFTCGAEESIWKAIKSARKLGISVDGPIPADSAFLLPSPFSLLPKYDAFVAMYHDQGMLPVKLLSQGSGACPAPFYKKDSSKCNLTGKTQASFKNWCGVNMTLGLPFIRTSPLHGVAFDIAGKNIADPSSMISAINLCLKLTKN
jgi:4-hydroxy-L-threonine phosphate dehydrogenase PdxA